MTRQGTAWYFAFPGQLLQVGEVGVDATSTFLFVTARIDASCEPER